MGAKTMPPWVHWGDAGAALAGVAGALLAPGLDAAAGDLGAGQGALSALTAVGQVVLDHLMDDGLVGLDAEDGLSRARSRRPCLPAMLTTLL